jgi:hypothetical protein
MMKAIVSVLIDTYDQERFIEEAIACEKGIFRAPTRKSWWWMMAQLTVRRMLFANSRLTCWGQLLEPLPM